MSFSVTAINCGSFHATAGETLLEAGLKAGFGFPHACRNGNCERCLARLDSGRVTQPRAAALVARHGSDALLCCQAQPQTDLSFHMEGLTAPGQLPLIEKTCQKIELLPLNDDVSLLRLRLPAGTPAQWYAGQYLNLRLDKRWLPFSIANAPIPGERILEVHFRHLSHHASACHNLAWLQQHDLVRVRLPQGHNFVDATPTRPLWFICGSTGFAPAHAMLQHLANQQYPGPLGLFWGVREDSDFYLPDAPRQLAQRLPGLTVHQVLSGRPTPGFAQGMAHEVAIKQLEHPEKPLFFVSGSPAMVDTVYQALRHAGAATDQILSDMLAPPNKRAEA